MPDGRSDADGAIPRLLSEAIDSFEKLEVAIHLHRSQNTPQTVLEIATALSLAGDAVEEALDELRRSRIVRRTSRPTGAWTFDTSGPWSASVEKLVAEYERDRFEIVNLMGRLAVARIRSHAARVFADAFVLRARTRKKEDPDA